MINIFRILKGLRVQKEGTLTPSAIEVIPQGTNSTTTTIESSQTANRTLTLPDITDTVVTRNTTDTLTNKTLTNPTISTINNGGTLTLPTGPDNIVARTSTDTLSNKSFSDPTTHTNQGATPSNPAAGNHKLYFRADGLYQLTSAGVETKLESGTAGTITNLVAPALANYDSGTGTFEFQENTVGPVAANLDAASILLRNKTPDSNEALTLSPPDNLTTDYEIKLPELPTASVSTIQNLVLGGGTNPEIFFAGTLRGGQSFLSPVTGTISSFDMGIYRTSATESGNIVLRIYSGFVDTVGPSGLVATSDPIDVTTVDTSTSNFQTFTFSTPVNVNFNTTYYALVESSTYVAGAGPFLTLATTFNLYPDGQAIAINDIIPQDARFDVDINVAGGTKFVQLTETGEMLADVTVDDNTLEISGPYIKVKEDGITATEIAPSTITTTELAASVLQMLMPTGTVLPYVATTAPTGYLVCNGASVLKTTYPALYAIIGDAYGTADINHFNLPDMRGMFMRGWANGSINDPDRASRTAANTGGATGDNIGSAQANQIQSHNHGITDPGHFHNHGMGADLGGPSFYGTRPVSGANVYFDNGGGPAFYNNAYLGSTDGTNITVNSSGGNQTNPINLNFNFIIKT